MLPHPDARLIGSGHVIHNAWVDLGFRTSRRHRVYPRVKVKVKVKVKVHVRVRVRVRWW